MINFPFKCLSQVLQQDQKLDRLTYISQVIPPGEAEFVRPIN